MGKVEMNLDLRLFDYARGGLVSSAKAFVEEGKCFRKIRPSVRIQRQIQWIPSILVHLQTLLVCNRVLQPQI